MSPFELSMALVGLFCGYWICKTKSNIIFFKIKFQAVRETDLQQLKSLEYLDLSRNLIGEIMPATFLAMTNLKGLDFSVNVIRKVRMNQRT